MTQTIAYAEQPKTLGKLFKWLRIFFIFYIIGEIILATGATLMLRFGSAMFGPGQPFTIGDTLEAIGALILAVGFFTSVVLFSIFSYRAVKNIRLWDANAINTKPGWAWGWYFIPIANLWKPYGVMSDMWYGSHNAEDAHWDTPSTMPIWWICWIATSISSNASTRMSIRAGLFEDYASDVPLYQTTLYIDIFSSLTGIIAAWLILGIIKVIAEKQDQRINAASFD
jgi:hypothetical protein